MRETTCVRFHGTIPAEVMSCSVRRRSRRTFSTHFAIFRRRVDGIVIYFFNSDFKFFDDASEFSVCSFYVFPRRRKGFDFDDESTFFSTTSDTNVMSCVRCRAHVKRLTYVGLTQFNTHKHNASICFNTFMLGGPSLPFSSLEPTLGSREGVEERCKLYSSIRNAFCEF